MKPTVRRRNFVSLALLAVMLFGPGIQRATLAVEEVYVYHMLVRTRDAAEAVVRCAQETVTNAVRHAGASRLVISVRRDGPQLIVVATDDGRGPRETDSDQGEGLRGMRKRAERLGGTMQVGAAEGGGFEVRLEIPMPGAAR